MTKQNFYDGSVAAEFLAPSIDDVPSCGQENDWRQAGLEPLPTEKYVVDDPWCRPAGRDRSSPGTSDAFTSQDAWDELVHKDDRTSPEEYPDMCLITFEELQDYILRATQPATPTGGEVETLRVELAAARSEIERLQDAKRRALALADTRAKEANELRARCSAGTEDDEFGTWFTKEIDDAKNGLSDCRTEGAGDQYASGYLDALTNVKNALPILRSPDVAQAGADPYQQDLEFANKANIKRARDFKAVVDWVDSWVSNPVGSYSVHALDGLFSVTREKIAALSLPSTHQPCPGCDGHECDDGCKYPGAVPRPQGNTP